MPARPARYAEALGLPSVHGGAPPPVLRAAIVAATADRYRQAYERLTGASAG